METDIEEKFKAFNQTIALFVLSILSGLLLAYPVMWAWNFVMDVLFGLPEITWAQSWCLMFIGKSIFGTTNINQSN